MVYFKNKKNLWNQERMWHHTSNSGPNWSIPFLVIFPSPSMALYRIYRLEWEYLNKTEWRKNV